MAAVLKDALKPNLVQTLENNIAIIHGGPFANIAHGCNTVIATQTALKLADYVITEAGFGADLGAEKFIDIKCRMAGLKPSAVVLVATIRALKFHGGMTIADLNEKREDEHPSAVWEHDDRALKALEKGFANLERHYHNITQHYGLPCVVCINNFTFDTEAEIKLLTEKCATINAPCIVSTHWAEGGAGAEDLATAVLDIVDNREAGCTFVYDEDLSLWEKIEAIATKLYGAANVTASAKVKAQLARWNVDYGKFPVCIAKTQMSFSTNPLAKGAPSGHTVEIRDVKLANGAGFIVAIAGDIMTMPGLPKVPAAERIDIDDDGRITGLF
jgi:formate--tetrahydrofolate ligase